MVETFKKLTDFQHARQRLEMYLGSREEHTQNLIYFDGQKLVLREFTWVPAMYTGLREIIDNALDEMIGHGHGDSLRVDYDPDKMELTVEDNGRGIPIDEKPQLGKGPAASILLSEARAGRNFDQRGAVAGVNGLGAAIVNFTSEWFQLDIWRDNKHFKQVWEEGTYRSADIHKTTGPDIKEAGKRRGTRIQYKPSARVYPKMVLPLDFVCSRVWDVAVANPKLKVYFNGERLVLPSTRDPLKTLYFGESQIATVDIQVPGFKSRFYVSPNFGEDETVHSIVNNIPVFEGGSHIDAFKSLFYQAVIDYTEKQAAKEKLKVKREDVAKGILILNVTQMDDAKFDSQTKVRLISEVQAKIKAGFLESDVKSMLRRNPEWVEAILDRCRERQGSKEMKVLEKAQKNLHKTKIANLNDATGRDRSACVLFLAEGDSAIGGMLDARQPDIHGGIALRGKILNVYEKKPMEVIQNAVITGILQSIGLTIGKKAIRADLRYGAVFLATDEDEDGKNITALLVNLFYKFWPELFADTAKPFVFKFATPFIILVKGNTRKYVYSHEYDQFQADLDAGKYSGWKVIRAKGLGRLTKADWEHSLQTPCLIPIVDDGNLKESLDLIFRGTRADDRKKWLET